MRVSVDRDLCQGHAMCELEAPEVFQVGRSDQVELLVDSVPPEHEEAVRLAVTYCPTRALTIEGGY
ncbi:MAG TPA: ferredoxin [Mycobacteriales bacterium]|nr:ferredoxin [Mycobacteriales bacterium]